MPSAEWRPALKGGINCILTKSLGLAPRICRAGLAFTYIYLHYTVIGLLYLTCTTLFKHKHVRTTKIHQNGRCRDWRGRLSRQRRKELFRRGCPFLPSPGGIVLHRRRSECDLHVCPHVPRQGKVEACDGSSRSISRGKSLSSHLESMPQVRQNTDDYWSLTCIEGND